MNSTFGNRLKELRKENDLTMDEFVDAINSKYPELNLKKSMISRYENNIHTPKQFIIIEDMAEFFGVNINYMTGKSDDKYGENILYKEIPILGTIAAGMPILAQEDILGHEYIRPNEHIDFCLKVKGDSMIGARIYDGDIVFIHAQPEVENGEIAAVQIENEEATLKRVYKVEGSLILHAENPMYKDQVISKKDRKDVTILGKAVMFKSEVR